MKKRKILASIIAFLVFISAFPESAMALETEKVEGTDSCIYYRIAPDDFDPLTATNEELEYYGYPARPTDSADLQLWEDVVTSKWVEPEVSADLSGTSSDAQEEESCNSAFSTEKTTTNWAGYVRNAASFGVKGNWEIPSVSVASGDKGDTAQWVGLGGRDTDTRKNTPLVQTGSQESISASGAKTYKLWYELLDCGFGSEDPFYITNIHPVPGDKIYAQVYISSFPTSDTCNITFIITDKTQNLSTGFFVRNIQDYVYLATSSEWISERPSYKSSIGGTVYCDYPKDYTDGHNRIHFWGCKYMSTYGSNKYTLLADKSNILKDIMTCIAEPTSISNGAFYINWKGYILI